MKESERRGRRGGTDAGQGGVTGMEAIRTNRMTLAMPLWAHIDRQWIMDQGIVVATGPGNLSRPEAEGAIPSSWARHKQQQQAPEQRRTVRFYFQTPKRPESRPALCRYVQCQYVPKGVGGHVVGRSFGLGIHLCLAGQVLLTLCERRGVKCVLD